ncbi:GXWXG domain-containing protein [Terriglobus saanensis]|uniref:Uncharacterized protein n=1 Tax=Terriglobus saanensis (strain ATCC BAA-1853 / DSM 23119 / SP1PR4) TaxID=401053 RepID=E8V8Q1_TERSS|nr:GXWXG domain-containing protein [Terriglobus saanensis]ADV84088.1 hypothetical protein AciPR4_3334 [Terriglobus saanensis SP1PR4]
MSNVTTFQQLKKEHKFSNDMKLWDLFDSLDSVGIEDSLGLYQGGGFDTGHWLFQLMGEMKWYGKNFVSQMGVVPLLCYNQEGHIYSEGMFGGASLWMTEFRGKPSVMLNYDKEPVFDHFRKVDNNTLLGIVNGKTLSNGKDIVENGKFQFVYLERVAELPAKFVTT